jgi:hypothetical protein
MNRLIRRFLLFLSLLALLYPALVPAVFAEDAEEVEEILLDPESEETTTEEPETAPDLTARDAFIDDIIALGKKLFDKARGKGQRAHYKSDIYICKNFTVYLFRQNRDKYRMAEYPDVSLVIPDNLPSAQCKPYYYGILWKDIPAEEGNPFYIAAEFRYDKNLSYEENLELAMAFMREVKRGDYFQMSADYQYGKGAHSAIMIADWDPDTDTVHWMDSNMRGGKHADGLRYGLVQYNEEKDVRWWAEAFCHKKRGATIYRLREDIIFAGSN